MKRDILINREPTVRSAATDLLVTAAPHVRFRFGEGAQSCTGEEEWKWAHLDSNQGPTGYEPAALSTELWAREGPTPLSGWLSPTAEEFDDESGRRESNPQQQLGRLRQYHFATPARVRPVGAAGLEPATSASQTQRASRLRHAPRSSVSIPPLAGLVKQDCRGAWSDNSRMDEGGRHSGPVVGQRGSLHSTGS